MAKKITSPDDPQDVESPSGDDVAIAVAPPEPETPPLAPVRSDNDTSKSDNLRAKVDSLIAERDALEADRAELQKRLVEAWGGKDATSAVQAVATNETKRAAIGTVIQRAEAEYQLALADDYAAQYVALKSELSELGNKRRAATEALVMAQQAYEQARFGTDQANGNLSGYLSSATSGVETATMGATEITTRFGRAADAHEAAKAAHDTLTNAGNDLREAEAFYMDVCHEYSLKERRAHELGALTNNPYDPGVRYLPG